MYLSKLPLVHTNPTAIVLSVDSDREILALLGLGLLLVTLPTFLSQVHDSLSFGVIDVYIYNT